MTTKVIRRVLRWLPSLLLLCVLPAQSQIPLPGPGALGSLGIWFVRGPAPSLMAQTGVPSGAFVDWVVKGSPAEQIGLQTADVIIELDGTAIANAEDIDHLFQLRKLRVGDTVPLKYVRKGTPLTATVTVSQPTAIFPRMRVPFLAKQIMERTWTENGVRRSHKTETKFHRDSAGRMAEENFRPVGIGGILHTASTVDSVNRVRVSINHFTKKARIVQSQGKLPSDFAFKESPVKWIQAQPSQYLGTKIIAGLSCEGYRVEGVVELPREFGITSDAPLSYSGERCLSDLTVYPVLDISEDPLQGRVVTRLVDIQEGVEPDPAIFAIPEGYQVEKVEVAHIWLDKPR